MDTTTNWKKLSYPRLCGLLAERPTRLSQAMHNAGFTAMQLPFFYIGFDLVDTAAAIRSMRELGLRGFSLTIPHKERAFSLVDEVSKEASVIGAINTIINTGSKLLGFNSDWIGIVEALKETKLEFVSKQVLLLGAGGAARAAAFSLGKIKTGKIDICNRTLKRAEEIARQFNLNLIELNDLSKTNLQSYDLIINATPMGSHLVDKCELPINVDYLNPDAVLFDMVTRETPLLKAASSRRIRTISGDRMLLFQAVEQFKLFTECEAPREAMEKALKAELAKPLS